MGHITGRDILLGYTKTMGTITMEELREEDSRTEDNAVVYHKEAPQ